VVCDRPVTHHSGPIAWPAKYNLRATFRGDQLSFNGL
jgi:hypothetical protein